MNELVNDQCLLAYIYIYNIFYIFDIEGMTKFILDVNFSMSAKVDE